MLFAAISVFSVGMFAYISGRDALRNAAATDVTSIAIEKKEALERWRGERLIEISNAAQILGETGVFETSISDSIPSVVLIPNEQLTRELKHVRGQHFLSLLVMDIEEGMVVASTDVKEEGKFKESRPYFLNGKQGPYVQNLYHSFQFGGPAITFSAPIRSPNGELLGVLAGRGNLSNINEVITRSSGLYKSEDVFIVDQANLFATQPRFIEDPSVLKRGVHTEAVDRCLGHADGSLAGEDYRGVPVVTAYRWLSESQFCLIVKVDQSEAYAPIVTLRNNIALFGVLALLVAWGLGLRIARSITRPLAALQAAVVQFHRREAHVDITTASQDELGDVSRAFNQMAKDRSRIDEELQMHRVHLERLVKDRTQELTLTNQHLNEEIIERREAELQVSASLVEKEVLLKEINHRVKNNLQIISSLINLQSRDVTDERALRAFQVSQERIRAMALVHEKLYQSEDMARIDFGEYIESLVADMRQSQGFGARQIELRVEAESIFLGLDIAIPCGLIVNELVSNSLKHAFPEGRPGEIIVGFYSKDEHFTVSVCDDGVGFPVGMDLSRTHSLGMTIVGSLAGQLGGSLAFQNDLGAKVNITFPAT